MRIKKPMIVSGAVVAAGLSGLVGFTAVHAATPTDGQQSLVDKIASTFNLNKNDVQKVFDEERQQHEADRQGKFETRVKQAVKDGKLTQDLADQLIAKVKELQTYRDSLKDKTPQERHDLMKVKMDDLKTWMKQNSVTMEFVGPMGGQAPDDAPSNQ
jgi:phosphate-selective porin